jgi:hypothetical protein
MTYTIPAKPTDEKQRYVIVTDALEIVAIQRNALRDPIGVVASDGTAWAEANSLAQFRGQQVEFDV